MATFRVIPDARRQERTTAKSLLFFVDKQLCQILRLV
jgi:hypothetical protein